MFLSILRKKRALIAFPYSIGPKGRIKRPAGTRSQLQNGAVQRGIGAQPQQAKKTSGLTAGCPFFASVLTLALLATMVTPSKRGKMTALCIGPYPREGTGLTMPCLSCHARFGKQSAGPPIAAFDLRRLRSGQAPHTRVTKQAESVVGSGGRRLKPFLIREACK